MSKYGGRIGRVVEEEQNTHLWEIPVFSALPKGEGVCFDSPHIVLAETRWWMDIYPNGMKGFPDRILLRLLRDDVGPTSTFRCTVGVRRADGGEETVGSQTVKIGHGHVPWVLFPFFKRAQDCVEGEFLSLDTLTLTLRIRDERDAESRSVMLLTKHMRELLSQSDDFDVRFRVQEKEFPAHRNILKARCPVFSMMLSHDTQEKRSGIIRIEDCDADAFEVFLMYVYTGKAEDLTPQKALNLYYIADKYDFPELKEQCVALIKASLSKTTVCDVLLLSAKYDESELMTAATNFFVQNVKEILVTVEWQKFMVEHPIEANELYMKCLNVYSNNI